LHYLQHLHIHPLMLLALQDRHLPPLFQQLLLLLLKSG
jgi:hypothetical protein